MTGLGSDAPLHRNNRAGHRTSLLPFGEIHGKGMIVAAGDFLDDVLPKRSFGSATKGGVIVAAGQDHGARSRRV